MSQSEQHKQQEKVVQYLNEAHASEQALVRVLQSQIAMTPRGSYRNGLETHLRETREHADRVGRRLQALGDGSNPLMAVVGVVETVVGQALALGKTPFDLLRGSGGEEKVLKNAKDACATEALEIATYTAIERLARSVGDEETARLAASILADEEKMLAAGPARDPEADRRRRARRRQGQVLLRRHYHGRRGCAPARPARRPSTRPARPAPRPSAPRVRPARSPGVAQAEGADQGRRRVRGRPRDRAL